MTREELVALARRVAHTHNLWPELVCAVCEQESGWNPWAIRFEPAFFERYVQPLYASGRISETEARARAFSWGLMQVMGQVARESGFTGEFLPALCDPEVGLELGCQLLARKLALADGNVSKALLLWNGGGNPSYPDQVLARAQKCK